MQFSRSRIILVSAFFIAVVLFICPPLSAAPIITSIDPNKGHRGEQDLLLKINGSGFMNGAHVFFENPGIHIDGPVVFINSTQLNIRVDIDFSAPLGPGDVFVINPDYQQNALVDGFTVILPEPPILDAVFPNSGYTGDSNLSVTLTGNLLYTVNSVSFASGITVVSINSISSTQIKCTISIDWLATPGFRDVTVSGPYGSDTLVNGFEIRAHNPPLLSGLIPDIGIQGETGKILIATGTGFFPGIDFEFLPPGNIDVLNVQYNNFNAATLKVDIHSDAFIQKYDVKVRNPDNQEYILSGGFRVRPPDPEIYSVNPSFGYLLDSGLPVTIFGNHLGIIDTVDFGSGITVTIVTVADTEIHVLLDVSFSAPLGYHDVMVSGMGYSDVLSAGFEVREPAPKLFMAQPNQAERGSQDYPVLITGEWLAKITNVNFGAGITAEIISASYSQLNVLIDAAPDAPVGMRDIVVTGANGQDTLVQGFEILPGAPSIFNVNPNQGYRGANDFPVTINGKNLDFVNDVSFGDGVTVQIYGISLNKVDVLLDIDPLAALGGRDVTITGTNGKDTLTSGFFILPNAPDIMYVDPKFGTRGEQDLAVKIFGNNLDLVDSVSFGNGISVEIVSIGMNLIDVRLDIDVLASPGFRDVVVSGLSGMDILPDGFEVLARAPDIKSVYPDKGLQGKQDYPVKISGTNLDEVDTVSFGEGIGVEIIYTAGDYIDVLLDIDAFAEPGFRDVQVSGTGGMDILENGFEVITRIPDIESVDPDKGKRGETNLSVALFGSNLDIVGNVSFGEGIKVEIVGLSNSRIDLLLSIDPMTSAGYRDVTVSAGGFQDILPSGFEVLVEKPMIVDVHPNNGVRGAIDLPVTITGTGFDYTESVSFGSEINVTISGFSYGEINVLLDIDPFAEIGFRDVSVVTQGGEDILTDGFKVLISQPEIHIVQPNSALRGVKDLPVVIKGNHLQSVNNVSFGEGITVGIIGVAPDRVNVEIDIDQTAEPGYRDVTVFTLDSQVVLKDGFRILIPPPDIVAVFPNQAVRGSTGIKVNIVGSGFEPGAIADFGKGITVDSIDVLDSQNIDCVISIKNDAVPGPRDVTVKNPDQQYDILSGGFTVTQTSVSSPVIHSLEPSFAYQNDKNLKVQMIGEGFRPGASVRFANPGINILGMKIVSDTRIELILNISHDALWGHMDVTIINPDSGQYILVNGFEVRRLISIDSVFPSKIFKGETVNMEVKGRGFEKGASIVILPDDRIELSETVVFPELIKCKVHVQIGAMSGFHNVRVTNPDGRSDILINAFEVIEKPLANYPPEVLEINPTEICSGKKGAHLTIYGSNFMPGARVIFEFGGSLANHIYDVKTEYINPSLIDVTLSIREDAPEGKYDVSVQNPDGQKALGPPLTILDCLGQGLLAWEETQLIMMVEVRKPEVRFVETRGSAMLMNLGDGELSNVVVSASKLKSSDGRVIPEGNIEINPSIVGLLDASERIEVSVTIQIPVSSNLLPPGSSLEFIGHIKATDTITGISSTLRLILQVVIPRLEIINIDADCMNIFLFSPGEPATGSGSAFSLKRGSNRILSETDFQDCESAFPVFIWEADGSGCKGYGEYWKSSFTLSVYPVYEGQKLAEVLRNVPVWRAEDIEDTSIQYPLTAQPLLGIYVWQIEAKPVEIPGSGVKVISGEPVISEVRIFCVEESKPASRPKEKNIIWIPKRLTLGKSASATVNVVISKSLAKSIIQSDLVAMTYNSPSQTKPKSVIVDMSSIELMEASPMPEFGPAAIEFTLSCINRDENSGNLILEIRNGRMQLMEISIGPGDSHEFDISIAIGNSLTILPISLQSATGD